MSDFVLYALIGSRAGQEESIPWILLLRQKNVRRQRWAGDHQGMLGVMINKLLASIPGYSPLIPRQYRMQHQFPDIARVPVVSQHDEKNRAQHKFSRNGRTQHTSCLFLRRESLPMPVMVLFGNRRRSLTSHPYRISCGSVANSFFGYGTDCCTDIGHWPSVAPFLCGDYTNLHFV